MSTLAYCIFRTQRIGALISNNVAKRSCALTGFKREDLPYNGKSPVLTVHKRTLIRKRELIGTSSSVNIKSAYKKDKIGPEYEFIYCSDNVRLYIWWTPLAFILITVILVLTGNIIVEDLWTGKHRENVDINKLWFEDFNPFEVACVLMPIAVCTLIVMLYSFKAVLLRLYYNRSTNEFIAVLLKYGVYREKVHFKQSDVVNLEKNRMRGNILIKDIPVRVSESSFRDIALYNILMGYRISRPSEYKQLQDRNDIGKTIERLKNQAEKKQTADFLKKYEEKRKLRQKKSR